MPFFETLQGAAPFLWSGALITLQIAAGGTVLAVVLSFVAGLASASRFFVIRAVARTYLEVFRGTSVIVQMFFIFYVLPGIIGYRLEALAASILAVGLNLGAYGSEVVRGAMDAVPKPQREAGIALNFTYVQRLRYIIFPQALVGMIPPFNNLWIELVKATALATAINVPELMSESSFLAGSYDRATVMVAVFVIYLLVAAVITVIMRTLERRAGRIVGREPRPLFKRTLKEVSATPPAPGGGG